ncbi:hypothetical protein ABZ446_28460 [Streptomyces sp. NPDC005813]|uniref:hypothetical protein n=1 Tax=Streptomyces sp. NPDC005813 TaxID=3155592 RepID=UPI0033C9E56E
MTQQKSWPEVIGGCIGAVALPFIQAWLLMLVFGALHTAYPAVVAVGYWTSLLFMVGINLAVATLQRVFAK